MELVASKKRRDSPHQHLVKQQVNLKIVKIILISIAILYLFLFLFLFRSLPFSQRLFEQGVAVYTAAVTDSDAFAAIRLTFIVTLLVVPLNTIFLELQRHG
ncbi:hypothetical protein GCM10020331_076320 [Ectobacillus funiculus]